MNSKLFFIFPVKYIKEMQIINQNNDFSLEYVDMGTSNVK